jgi:hypothetical protein
MNADTKSSSASGGPSVRYPFVPYPVELADMERRRVIPEPQLRILALRRFADPATGNWETTTEEIVRFIRAGRSTAQKALRQLEQAQYVHLRDVRGRTVRRVVSFGGFPAPTYPTERKPALRWDEKIVASGSQSDGVVAPVAEWARAAQPPSVAAAQWGPSKGPYRRKAWDSSRTYLVRGVPWTGAGPRLVPVAGTALLAAVPSRRPHGDLCPAGRWGRSAPAGRILPGVALPARRTGDRLWSVPARASGVMGESVPPALKVARVRGIAWSDYPPGASAVRPGPPRACLARRARHEKAAQG